MDGGLGVGLLEEAFRSPAEENVGPAHTVEWDHSLAELTHASRSPIPGKVREAFGRARQRANCGLFAEGLAWASSDDVLYLWDYSDMSPSVHSVPGDSAIITVALCPAKSGIFETQQPRWVLVIATRLSVSLVGVNFARTQIRASSAPDAIPANVSLSDWTSSARAGIPGVPVNSIQSQSSLHFVPLQGFRALCEGALFHSIHSSPGGRIFLLSGAPHIYELVCSHGWYRAKCRLVRHSVGPGWWKSPKPGRLRLLSCGPAGHILTCDDVGTLRLCCVMDQIGGSSTLEELASLSAAALRDQVRAITQGSLASFTLTHLFCWMGATGQLLLDATTIAGERLHFVCSVEGSTRRKYGFWLQHLASSWSSSSSCPESHESRSVRISCLEEHPDPCFFAPGADGASTLGSVWLCAALRRAGASASDLAVSVRLNGVPHDFQPLSPNQAVEMQGMLSFDAPVLAIAQEESQPTCQKFAVLLADRVQTVTITHQASAAKRAPAEAAECCLFLQSLTSGAASGGVTGSRIQYDWCWSLDDARFPTFEEQRRAQLLNQAVPKMILGRWPSGLLRFLSETLRSVWTRPVLLAPARVVEVPSLPLSLCRKRRRCASPPIVAISELAAKKIFSQLQPVIQFVAKGLAHNAEEQVPFGTPCSAAMRAQLYVKRTEDAHAPSSCDSAQGRVRRAMLDLLDVMDRTRQVLGLIIILHKSGCTQAVLDSAPLQEHEPATASQGAAEPADVLLPTAAALLLSRSLRDLALSPSALWPAVQLCTALVLQAVQGNADDSPEQEGFGRSAVGLPHQSEADSICKELQDCCPAIFSQVDLKRCLRRADWQSTSSKQALSMLRRYAGSLPTGSSPPEWQLLCRGIRALASEEPGMAAELCAERVCKLADSWPDSEERCRDLISSLLDAMSLERLAEAATALEVFLKRSRASACRLPGSNEPVFHHITFDHLLSTPRLHSLLEAILNTNAADVKAILQRRSASSRTASELLWRYFQRQGHERPAWAQLQRLVEAPEQFYNLKDRIRYLHLAQEQRKSVSSASLQEELSLRLGAAEKLQQPLLQELLVMAGNEKQDARWRDAARKRCSELQHLRSARELYEVAGEFGFWHLQLGIAGFSGVKMAHDVVTTLWAGFLFPADGPYNSQSDEVASPKLLFPLLMWRPHTCFFASKQDEVDWQLKPSLLRDRVLAFLQELKEVARTSHQLWHVRGIATLLEFSSCLWLNALQKVGHTTEFQEKGGDGAAGSSLIDENRLWVALEVLMQKPFSFSLPDLITFYAEMIAQLDAWHADLQETSAYSPARRWAWPTEEDVHLHLSHVAIVLLASWLREAERTCESISESCAEAESEFVRVWRRSADGLLSGLCLRLNHARHHSAQRLLGEALRLEKGCRLLLDRVVYLGPEKHFAGDAQSAQ